MALFAKRVEKKKNCCGNCDGEEIIKAKAVLAQGSDIKILGSGCKKCNQLELNTKEALQKLGMDTAIDHVTDFAMIASYGVMTTPALVFDGKILSYGKVLKAEEIIELINRERG